MLIIYGMSSALWKWRDICVLCVQLIARARSRVQREDTLWRKHETSIDFMWRHYQFKVLVKCRIYFRISCFLWLQNQQIAFVATASHWQRMFKVVLNSTWNCHFLCHRRRHGIPSDFEFAAHMFHPHLNQLSYMNYFLVLKYSLVYVYK